MKKIVAVAVIALFAGAAQAADNGAYVRLDSGWSFSRDADKGLENGISNSPTVGVGLGARAGYVRADVTLGIMGDVSVVTGMANVYFDVARVLRFAPYIGAGFGLSSNTVSDLLCGDAPSYAWQLSAGVGIDVAPNWTVDVGYRHMDVGPSLIGDLLFNSSTLEHPGKVDFRAHEIQAGIRYQF